MSGRNRSNPLALAVLICLFERPMHPYEVASTLRQRHKQESVRLNYGSLYAVVASLERRRLVAPVETEREGRLPERTVYELTAAGRAEMHEWLAELVSIPSKEYPSFEAALSFLPALAPGEAVALLEERIQRLEIQLALGDAAREHVDRLGIPRLLWVEAEYRGALLHAEHEYVVRLVEEIRTGTLDGSDWWRAVFADPGRPTPVPLPGLGVHDVGHRAEKTD
ncbi:MAG: PadR family transcriptional regulator [Actinomycetota bacterium]|nr:PadR family transcriptional regulator [Actinomycetota bacterium]